MNKDRCRCAVRTGATIAVALVSSLACGAALAAGACAISSSGLAFGAYQPLTFPGKLVSVERPSTATVSVMCTGIAAGGAYSIGLGPGTYGAGDRISTRYLNNTVNGGALMEFNVYADAGYTTVWGNGIIGSVFSGSIPAGDSTRTHTAYGKVPAGQNTLKAGSFSDWLTMTITYNP
jgi:spore coat protein U-like protein